MFRNPTKTHTPSSPSRRRAGKTTQPPHAFPAPQSSRSSTTSTPYQHQSSGAPSNRESSDTKTLGNATAPTPPDMTHRHQRQTQSTSQTSTLNIRHQVYIYNLFKKSHLHKFQRFKNLNRRNFYKEPKPYLEVVSRSCTKNTILLPIRLKLVSLLEKYSVVPKSRITSSSIPVLWNFCTALTEIRDRYDIIIE